MIRAIVFDMDGVLVDARHWHFEALNRALRLFGYEISAADHRATFDGLPTRVKLEKLIEKRGLPRGLGPFIAEMKQIYTLEIIRQNCRPTFLHEYALSRLKAEGYRIAVASNSIRETVDTMMAKTCLIEHLDLTLSSEDVAAAKPDPEIYLLGAERLGVSPAECLVVEDNHNGVKAARAAGTALMHVSGTDDVAYDRIKKRIAEIDAGGAP
jgi:HAD superfamily hydrolase (TIGR01509 family)